MTFNRWTVVSIGNQKPTNKMPEKVILPPGIYVVTMQTNGVVKTIQKIRDSNEVEILFSETFHL